MPVPGRGNTAKPQTQADVRHGLRMTYQLTVAQRETLGSESRGQEMSREAPSDTHSLTSVAPGRYIYVQFSLESFGLYLQLRGSESLYNLA